VDRDHLLQMIVIIGSGDHDRVGRCGVPVGH